MQKSGVEMGFLGLDKTFEVLVLEVVGNPSACYFSSTIGCEGFSVLDFSELLTIYYIWLSGLITGLSFYFQFLICYTTE